MSIRTTFNFLFALGLLAGSLTGRCYCLTLNNWELAPPESGAWNEPAHWSNGVPTGIFGEVALVNNDGIASITQDTSINDLILGQNAADSGNLIQNGSTLTLFGDLAIGEYGTGTFEFSGGLLRSGNVLVAVRNGSHGTLLISGGMFRPGYILLGRDFNLFPPNSGGNATVIQTAGTVEVFYAALTIEGDQSSYELRGGTLRALDQIVHGRGLNNRFIQSGGINDAHSPSGGGYYSGALRVGIESAQLATYELSGGDLLTNYTGVGSYMGHGMFVQTGGLHHVYGNLSVGYEGMSTGTYEMRNGTLLVDQTLYVGIDGTGTFSTFGSGSTIDVRDLNVESTGSLVYSIFKSGVSATTVSRNAMVEGALSVVDAGARTGTFLLIDASNSMSFNPAFIQLPGPKWSLQQVGEQVFVTHVPEPHSAVLLLSMIGLMHRRLKNNKFPIRS